jgi:hypothetical protein
MKIFSKAALVFACALHFANVAYSQATQPSSRISIISDATEPGNPRKMPSLFEQMIRIGDIGSIREHTITRCMGSKTCYPILSDGGLTDAKNAFSDYYILELGKADALIQLADPASSSVQTKTFTDNYLEVISQLRALPNKPIVILALPNRVFPANYIRNPLFEPVKAIDNITSLIENIAIEASAPIIDVSPLLENKLTRTVGGTDEFIDVTQNLYNLTHRGYSKMATLAIRSICNNSRSPDTCAKLNTAATGIATASPSSYFPNNFNFGLPSHAVDQDLNSAAIIGNSNSAWWQLDLGSSQNFKFGQLSFYNYQNTPLSVYVITSKTPFTSASLSEEIAKKTTVSYPISLNSKGKIDIPILFNDPTKSTGLFSDSNKFRYVRVWVKPTASASALGIVNFKLIK